MTLDSGNNIRVFVRWDDDSTVFAGEELKCTIAFKNIAAPAAPGLSNSHPAQLKPPPNQLRPPSSFNPSSRLAPPPSASALSSTSNPRRGHRSTSSFNVPTTKTTRSRTGSVPWSPTPLPPSDSQSTNGHSHKRSVSIVSIGSVASVDSQATSNAGSTVSRPSRGHGRSSSLQIVARGPVLSGPKSGTLPRIARSKPQVSSDLLS